jgi:dimethylargininase
MAREACSEGLGRIAGPFVAFACERTTLHALRRSCEERRMLPFAPPARLVARQVSARYAECVRSDPKLVIDVAAARRQHAGYVEALRALGLQVDVLPAEDDAPDACFVEDTAVVTGAHAVATRPGAESRRAEVASVARELARDRVVGTMSSPATLDGGDVLRVAGRLFVGLSSRTNRAGLDALAAFAARDGLDVVPLTVRDGLHLKSACTLASASLLVIDPRVIGDEERAAFVEAGLTILAVDEPAGANVLAIGDAVLVSSAAPRTAELLRAKGLDVRVVDVGEFHKGDGALTCLSLRVPREGAWAT